LSNDHRRQAILLFLALGLVAAFVVSFVASLTGVPGGAHGPADPTPDASSIRVEVLNAAGQAGLARTATERLRGRGFDVVYFGNAPAFGQDSSVVVARTGRLDDAHEVARALGIKSVESQPDSTLLLEVTVVLGSDWPPKPGQKRGVLESLQDLVNRVRGKR
jgi:hypothetical protein